MYTIVQKYETIHYEFLNCISSIHVSCHRKLNTIFFSNIAIKETSVEAGTGTLSPVLFEDSPSTSPFVPVADGKVEVFGTCPEEAVREMRFRIEQKTTLTASAGNINSYCILHIYNRHN